MKNADQSAMSVGRQAVGLGLWLLLCFSASATAAFVKMDDWYTELVKPTWNPPGWLFGPVWTVLYAMMAVAAWMVWRRGGWRSNGLALGAFMVQWVLNVLWTPLFFGMHQPGLAFADIVALWAAIVVTIVLFWKVSRGAAAMLVPYLMWVSFAAVLNLTIWQLNA